MRIASWNVNSVRLRLPALLAYLKETAPDVIALQELKCQDDAFPRQEIEDAGYNVAAFGQKSLNGVALLTKTPLEDVTRGLPGFPGPAVPLYRRRRFGRERRRLARGVDLSAERQSARQREIPL